MANLTYLYMKTAKNWQNLYPIDRTLPLITGFSRKCETYHPNNGWLVIKRPHLSQPKVKMSLQSPVQKSCIKPSAKVLFKQHNI